MQLPIKAIKNEFIQALINHNTLVLSAPPGAGKSTCLPLWLLDLAEFSGQKIYLLQPRRVAVKNIALYLASQLGESVGKRIGYRLRDETKVSKHTKLEVITEGILTQIIQQDPELSGCGLLLFDEFHERSLQGDLAFALARDVQLNLRDDLTIVLMSATLNNSFLKEKLPDAICLHSEGRSYPVEVEYQAANNIQQWQHHALAVIKAQLNAYTANADHSNSKEEDGSILVFLSGVADIRFLAEQLETCLPPQWQLQCLYGNLPLKTQQQILSPCEQGQHKLVLSTNIAETSLTIDGINCVIDCGFEKRAIYDAATLTNKLITQQIAKASAIQRAGRAGRLMAGKCIRLYSKDDFERCQEHAPSDIQQADLLPLLIEAARWGVNKLADLPLLELPNFTKEQQAWQELQQLALINITHHGVKLSALGEQAAQLSCHPRFAKMILQAKLQNSLLISKTAACLACIVAALLEEKDIFSYQQGNNLNSDIRQRLTLLLQKPQQYDRIFQQAQRLSQQANITWQHSFAELSVDDVGVLLALAYPERIAKQRSINTSDYLCANGKGIRLAQHDNLLTEAYIVAANLQQTRDHQLIVRLAAPINADDIERLFSDHIVSEYKLSYDENKEKIIARQQRKLFSLILSQQQMSQQQISQQSSKTPTQEDIATMWCELVQQKGLDFLPWQAPDNALKSRWQWLHHFVNSDDFPLLTNEYLLAHLSQWFSPFVGNIKTKKQLAQLNLSECLLSILNYQQQQLFSQLAPEVYIGPTGRRCPISYHPEQQSPKVSLPMQEVYGLTETPQVGETQKGKGIALLLELLSPAGRPIQITQNLPQFWQGSYAQVQKEMKARYPKHYWPDDPANAKATNKTKRYII